jgi:hypothetical protein
MYTSPVALFRRRLPHAVVSFALLAGFTVATAPAAHADTTPASCMSFIQKYFMDTPAGYTADFTLVTESVLTKATYAEGTAQVSKNIVNSSWSGSGKQYFSDRRYEVPSPPPTGWDFNVGPADSYPFDRTKTAPLQVKLGRATGLNSPNGSGNLWFVVTSNGVTENVVPVGCVGVQHVIHRDD